MAWIKKKQIIPQEEKAIYEDDIPEITEDEKGPYDEDEDELETPRLPQLPPIPPKRPAIKPNAPVTTSKRRLEKYAASEIPTATSIIIENTQTGEQMSIIEAIVKILNAVDPE